MGTDYVRTLPREVQLDIAYALIGAGVTGDDLERAMDSRLCDLEDTIDVGEWRRR